MYIPQQEKGRQNEDNYTTIKYKYFQDDVDGLRLRQQKDLDKADITTKLSWIAFQDQFFLFCTDYQRFFSEWYSLFYKNTESEKYIRYFTSEVGVPFNSGSRRHRWG